MCNADFVAQGTGLLSSACLAAMAVATFIAATPWLRAYQVARAPLILALAALLPVAIAGALSRALRLPPLLSYAGSFAGLVVARGHQQLRLQRGLGRPGARARPVAHRDPPPERAAYLLVGPDRGDLALRSHLGRAVGPACAPRRAAALVPVLCFVFAFVFTTSAPAESSVAEAAALAGRTDALGARPPCHPGAAAGAGRGRAGTALARVVPPRSAWAATGAAMAVLLAAALTLAVPGALSFAGKPKTVSRATPVVNPTSSWTRSMLSPRCATPTRAPRRRRSSRAGARTLERVTCRWQPLTTTTETPGVSRPLSSPPVDGCRRPAAGAD